jgi:hypothetical protein
VNQALVFGVDVATTGTLRRDNYRISFDIISVTRLALASYWLAACLLAEVPTGSYTLLRLLLFAYNRLFKLADK